jgi:hypothetical protein
MDDRLRRCSIHGPELRAYVEALVKAEAELTADAKAMGLDKAITQTLKASLIEVHDDDGGEVD